MYEYTDIPSWKQRIRAAPSSQFAQTSLFLQRFIIVAVITAIGLLYRVATFLPGFRQILLRTKSRLASSGSVEAVTRRCEIGDWFLLYQLGKDIDLGLFAGGDEEACLRKSIYWKNYDNVYTMCYMCMCIYSLVYRVKLCVCAYLGVSRFVSNTNTTISFFFSQEHGSSHIQGVHERTSLQAGRKKLIPEVSQKKKLRNTFLFLYQRS